jgi:hypothetical protein
LVFCGLDELFPVPSEKSAIFFIDSPVPVASHLGQKCDPVAQRADCHL